MDLMKKSKNELLKGRSNSIKMFGKKFHQMRKILSIKCLLMILKIGFQLGKLSTAIGFRVAHKKENQMQKSLKTYESSMYFNSKKIL
jgi:hypothetical protein